MEKIRSKNLTKRTYIVRIVPEDSLTGYYDGVNRSPAGHRGVPTTILPSIKDRIEDSKGEERTIIKIKVGEKNSQ